MHIAHDMKNIKENKVMEAGVDKKTKTKIVDNLV